MELDQKKTGGGRFGSKRLYRLKDGISGPFQAIRIILREDFNTGKGGRHWPLYFAAEARLCAKNRCRVRESRFGGRGKWRETYEKW